MEDDAPRGDGTPHWDKADSDETKTREGTGHLNGFEKKSKSTWKKALQLTLLSTSAEPPPTPLHPLPTTFPKWIPFRSLAHFESSVFCCFAFFFWICFFVFFLYIFFSVPASSISLRAARYLSLMLLWVCVCECCVRKRDLTSQWENLKWKEKYAKRCGGGIHLLLNRHLCIVFLFIGESLLISFFFVIPLWIRYGGLDNQHGNRSAVFELFTFIAKVE